ncbi:MAG TPA: class I SAM-dependent methyltransferase [Dongiaceae bacterium]|nr:class I SAM-dependent methyltransferase [Dongiaceae bacterium]
MPSEHSPSDLQTLYRTRFAANSDYRQQVWAVLVTFFARWIPKDAVVLDLGCGWCEFINAVACSKKLAMDLNPDAKRNAARDVQVLEQDCSERWALGDDTLQVVFTSNFLEHLPNKSAVERTLLEAYRSLQPGGRLIAMGPNIKCVPGAYWDFFDHYVPLTELSLAEILEKSGFQVEVRRERFLPYTMSHGRNYPLWMLRLYLAMPWLWRFAGAQFLVVARKP